MQFQVTLFIFAELWIVDRRWDVFFLSFPFFFLLKTSFRGLFPAFGFFPLPSILWFQFFATNTGSEASSERFYFPFAWNMVMVLGIQRLELKLPFCDNPFIAQTSFELGMLFFPLRLWVPGVEMVFLPFVCPWFLVSFPVILSARATCLNFSFSFHPPPPPRVSPP